MSDIQDPVRRRPAARAVPDPQFRALLERLPAGAYTCDAEGLITYFNRRAVEVWGREPALMSPEDRFCGSFRLFAADGTAIEPRECWMALALRDDREYLGCEILIERPDGGRRRVLAHATPLHDSRKRLIGAVNVLVDVTDLKQTEEMRSRLAAIVESSHDAIIGKDLNGVVTSWNAGAERLFGYPAAEMLGKSVECLYEAERRGEEASILARIRSGKRVDHYETVRLRKDGRPVEISITVSPVRDDQGRIVGASSVAQDVGNRRAAERAIRENEERYRSLVEASGAIVFTSEASANWASPQPAWGSYTRQTFEQYRGFGWILALHPDDRAAVEAEVAHAVAEGTVWEAEGRLWHASSGTYRHQDMRSVPIRGPDDTIREWVGTCTDVHGRKVAEEAVREADRRKDEFLAVLAHELRNPLAPICSSMQILRMESSSDAARGPVLEVMERQVHHLVRLVDDLLEVSRITRGTIELRKEPLAVEEPLRAAIEISRPLIEAQLHRLDVVVPPVPLMIRGDRVRLTQIVANLLNNAARYTPRGGLIRVVVETQGPDALIRVIDKGVGIAPGLQGRIFDMFFQGDRTTERFSGGLGIGLSLAKRLAELHGGSVQVCSAGEGQGSEFTLRLPLAEPVSAAAAQRLPAGAPGLKPRRVLVVDDNRDAAFALARLLEVLGHEVHTANDGDEALALGEAVHPDIVLLDIGMPTLSGCEVAQRMRQRPWGRSVQLVAVTGWGQEADRRRTRESGFDFHLVKPVDLTELQSALGHH